MNQRLKQSVLAILIAFLAGCGSKQTPEELIATARQQIQAGQQQQAIINLKTALQERPSDSEARILLAQSLQAQGEWQASEDELIKAATHGGSAEAILPLRAQALLKLGKFPELIQLEIPKAGIASTAYATILAKRALAFLATDKPEDARSAIQEGEKSLANANLTEPSKDIQLGKAGLAAYSGEFDKALEILSGIEQHHPDSIDALNIKGNLLLKLGRTDAALEQYRRIIKHSPGDTQALAAATNILIEKGALAEAEKTLAVLESKQKAQLLASTLRAYLAMRKGGEENLRKADASIQQVLNVIPDNQLALILAAEVNDRLGNHEASYKAASRVLAMQPDQLDSGLVAARAYLRRGEVTEAIGLLERLGGTHKDNAKLLALLGEANLAAGRIAAGMGTLAKAATLAPKSAEIAILQARGYRAQGNMNEALARLRQASQMDDKQGLANELLFQWLMELKQPEKALQAADDYLKKFPSSPVAQNMKAVAFMDMNKRREAVMLWSRIIQTDPGYFPAASNLASIDVESGDTAAARKRFQAVLDKHPRNGEAMLALANLALMEKKDAEFIRWMETAIKTWPARLPYRSRLIEYYLSIKDKKQALATAMAASGDNSGSATAMVILAKTQQILGETERALVSFRQAATMSPKSADAAMLLGLAQQQAGQFKEARTNLERAKALGSNKAQLYDGLLKLEAQAGNFPQALVYARQIRTLLPGSAIGHDREGELLLRLGRPAEALASLQKALAIEASPKRVIRLHNALTSSNRGAEADKFLADWIRKYPKSIDLRAYQAEVHTKAGRNQEAIGQYETILAQHPSDVPTMNNLALLLRQSNPARALQLAEKCLQYAPGEANVRDTLGQILMDTQNRNRAIKQFEEAVRLAPGNPSFRYHLADAYQLAGQQNKIVELLRPALGARVHFPERGEAQALYEKSGGK